MSKLTEIFNYIVEFKTNHRGKSPSYDEIGAALGISSKSNVSFWLKKLEADGLIIIHEGSRSIDIPNSVWRLEN